MRCFCVCRIIPSNRLKFLIRFLINLLFDVSNQFIFWVENKFGPTIEGVVYQESMLNKMPSRFSGKDTHHFILTGEYNAKIFWTRKKHIYIKPRDKSGGCCGNWRPLLWNQASQNTPALLILLLQQKIDISTIALAEK